MKRLLIAFVSTALSASLALSDHMNGTYYGVGSNAGSTLDLVQRNRALTGTISGKIKATLTGRTDGKDNATGNLEMSSGASLDFTSTWSSEGFAMSVATPDGKRQ